MASRVSQHDLDRLQDAFLDMRDKKARIRREIERRYRDKIEEEIEFECRAVERAFAVQLVDLKEAGATRRELVKIIGDGTASVMRHYIELGGGEVRKRQTGEDRTRERRKALGITRIAGNRYEWKIEGHTYPVTLMERNGHPILWPEGDALTALRDEHGVTLDDLREKGREVADEYGME